MLGYSGMIAKANKTEEKQMRSTASKIKQIQSDNIGFATMIDNHIAPYVLIAATKVDVVNLIASLEKISTDEVNRKKIYRVKIVRAEPKKKKTKPAKRR
jgi:hypothetical protein